MDNSIPAPLPFATVFLVPLGATKILEEEEGVSPENLRHHIEALSAIGERSAYASNMDGIKKAKDYITQKLTDYGYSFYAQNFVVERRLPDGIKNNFSITSACRQGEASDKIKIEIQGKPIIIFDRIFCLPASPKGKEVSNIIVRIPGRSSSKKIILGAHYDSKGHGANDNASGVAVLLEVVRLFSKSKPEFTLEIVFFVGEELGNLGSKYYLGQMSTEEKLKIGGVIIVDMVGNNKSDEEGAPLENLDIMYSKEAAKLAKDIEKAITKDGIIETRLSFISGEASDDDEFREEGIPTILFSEDTPDELRHQNDCFNRPCDTPDKIDYVFLQQATEVIASSVDFLTGIKK